MTRRLILLSGFCCAIPFLKAQDEPAPAPAPQQEALPAAPVGRGGGRGGAANEPRPYDRVITKDAKTSVGVFKVHFVRDRGAERVLGDLVHEQEILAHFGLRNLVIVMVGAAVADEMYLEHAHRGFGVLGNHAVVGTWLVGRAAAPSSAAHGSGR